MMDRPALAPVASGVPRCSRPAVKKKETQNTATKTSRKPQIVLVAVAAAKHVGPKHRLLLSL